MVLWLCMCIVYVHVLCLCCLFIFIYLFHNIFIDLGIYLLYMSYQQYLICYLHIKEPFGIKSSLYFFSSLKIQSHKVQTHHQWFLSSSISVSRIHGYENFIYRMIDTSGLPWDEAIFHAAAAGPARVLWRGEQPPGDCVVWTLALETNRHWAPAPRRHTTRCYLPSTLTSLWGASTLHSHIGGGKPQLRVRESF